MISILMNCHNGSRYLRQAIDSIYAQTYPDWEIIFWDNASTDESSSIARSFDGRLKYFKGDKKVPLGEARNLALRQARGEWIGFLDTDDLWLPGKLARQTEQMKSCPGAAFLYSNYYRLHMTKGEKRTVGLKGLQPQGEVFSRFLRHYPVNLQTVLLKKEVIQKSGVQFDRILELSEEFDFFMRILFTGCRASYCTDPLVVYRIHPQMSSWQFLEKYPKEAAYVLSKLKTLEPDFVKHYASPVRFFEAKIDYWHFKDAVVKGDLLSARKCLKPRIFLDIRFMVLYLITFLPAMAREKLFHLIFFLK